MPYGFERFIYALQNWRNSIILMQTPKPQGVPRKCAALCYVRTVDGLRGHTEGRMFWEWVFLYFTPSDTNSMPSILLMFQIMGYVLCTKFPTRTIRGGSVFSVQPYHHFSVQPYHNFSVQPYHHFSVQPYHHFSVQPYYHFSVQPYHHFSVQPYHHFSVQPYHHFSVQPYHHFSVQPYHHFN